MNYAVSIIFIAFMTYLTLVVKQFREEENANAVEIEKIKDYLEMEAIEDETELETETNKEE